MLKKIISAGLLFVIIFLPNVFAAARNDLANLLNSYQTYQAYFTQSTYDSSNRLVGSGSGQVMLMRPGKFLWQTEQPEQQTIISDGNYLWIYDIDLAQVTRRPLNSRKVINPAMLLTNDANEVLKRFVVTSHGDWFVLRPYYLQGSEFKEILLIFQNNQLTQIQVSDSFGHKTQFTFTQIQINTSLDPTLFQFTPPAGVQVIQSS